MRSGAYATLYDSVTGRSDRFRVLVEVSERVRWNYRNDRNKSRKGNCDSIKTMNCLLNIEFLIDIFFRLLKIGPVSSASKFLSLYYSSEKNLSHSLSFLDLVHESR